MGSPGRPPRQGGAWEFFIKRVVRACVCVCVSEWSERGDTYLSMLWKGGKGGAMTPWLYSVLFIIAAHATPRTSRSTSAAWRARGGESE